MEITLELPRGKTILQISETESVSNFDTTAVNGKPEVAVLAKNGSRKRTYDGDERSGRTWPRSALQEHD